MSEQYSPPPPVMAASGPSGPRAGFWQRFAAAFIDGILVGIVYGVLYEALKTPGYILALVIAVAYYAYFEGGPTGQTLGKRAMGIRVYDFTRRRADRLRPRRRPLLRADLSAIPCLSRLLLDALGQGEAVLARQARHRRRRARLRLSRRTPLSDVGLGGPAAVELGVAPAALEELVVRALLDDGPVLEHDDQVRAADGREAVGDDERGAAVEQAPQRVLDPALGGDVDRARRLVEDQDRAGRRAARARRRRAGAGRARGASRARRGSCRSRPRAPR